MAQERPYRGIGRVDESRDGPATGLGRLDSARGRPIHIRREPHKLVTTLDPAPQSLGLLCPPVHAHVSEQRFGQPVFKGESAVATIVEHVRTPPVPPSQRTEIDIPEALEKVILSCLEKDAADRPQTAADLSALLASSLPVDDWDGARAEEWWRLELPEPAAVDRGPPEESRPQKIMQVHL